MEAKTNIEKVLFIKAITPLHAGAGQGLDHIDLPIQREQATRFPIIYASGVKGAFRQKALEIAKSEDCPGLSLNQLDEEVEEYSNCPERKSEKNSEGCEKAIKVLAKIFGSRDCKGSITFSDAKILFFPVRSLRGVFAYTTCPMVLKRYAEDTGNKKLSEMVESLKVSSSEVLAPDTLEVEKENNTVVLEEFELKRKDLPEELRENLNLPDDLKNQIFERVAIVSDDLFRYFVENLTEVVTRIKVNPETGTVNHGMLWTEEYLPAESVLYSLLFNTKEVDTEKYLTTEGVITLGGNQTVGKGIVKVFSWEVKEDANA